ncbi:MAG: hypothetical protein DRN14_00200 [Thermoplasmata archaeon]|nr:MAG: hypothetical protein DRN14_00200 [Thermoplasmata archaeon]
MEATITMESVWEQYKEMIYNIAWKMAKQHNEDFDELVSEGINGVMKYLPRYDSAKSSLCTWVYRSAWDEMKSYCINPKRKRHVATDFSDLTDDNDLAHQLPSTSSWIGDIMQEIGDEARALVKVVCEAPDELRKEIIRGKQERRAEALKAYMIDVLDWHPEKVNTVWREVSACL